MDNYLEGLHIPIVHPELNKTINYKSYKTEIHDQFSLQWCSIDQQLNPYKNGLSKVGHQAVKARKATKVLEEEARFQAVLDNLEKHK